MRQFTMSFAVCALVAAGAQAQSTDPASSATPHQQAVTGSAVAMPPATPTSSSPAAGASPHQMAVTRMNGAMGGAQFVTKASEAGMAEVELSKLALNKANDPQVKAFANQMVQDHTKANDELKSIASKSGMPVSAILNPEHAAKVRDLGQKSGKAFEQGYVQQMTADHQEAIALFQQETGDSNSELASFAGKTLPVLQHHQEMVSMLNKR